MMEKLAIAERRILRNILGPIMREINTEGGIIMNFINVLRRLQTLLEKEEDCFYGHLQRMNSKTHRKNF